MYTVPKHIDKNKIFLVKRSELEGKLEVSYHLPWISELENKVRNRSNKKLKDFIEKLSSGATPSVTEEDKYYSDFENGIPFLRVQNLQVNGQLNLTDVKYINKETHEGYLKRSQVNEGDLLVKITGVGRMAIASLAPDNFVGNTNQHMAVIKTKDRAKSEYLVNYLNLDFVEKLATRRATGGTRPALDYPALKSIPIVEDINFSLLRDAEKIKQAKESEAKALLGSIDTYLLNELGIILPVKGKSSEERLFTVKFSEVVGGRFDPFGITSKQMKIEGGRYENYYLKKLAVLQKGQSITSDKIIDGDYPVIAGGQTSPYNHKVYNNKGNVITVSASGAYSGFVWYHKSPIFASDCTMIYSKDEGKISTIFLSEILKSKQPEIYSLQQGAGQPHVYARDLEKLRIPLPPMAKQNEISEHIAGIRAKAKALQQEADQVFAEAKQKVEKIILG